MGGEKVLKRVEQVQNGVEMCSNRVKSTQTSRASTEME